MQKTKKGLLFLFISLFLVSIYQDLTVGTALKSFQNTEDRNSEEEKSIPAVKAQVQTGDTVLSMVERISEQNKSANQLDVSQIMADFKTLNPNVSPFDLKPGEYYYFPVY